MSTSDKGESTVVRGRECGACTLCCKLLAIEELGKAHGDWCNHCQVGVGCKIYNQRPSECRKFDCGYLAWSRTGDHWYPANSKMVIVLDNDGNRLAIHVDPARPNAWRAQPFYAEIKEWARLATAEAKHVVVCIRDRMIVILPEEDVDLGAVATDERIATGEVVENGRQRKIAFKVQADDPRLQRGDRHRVVY